VDVRDQGEPEKTQVLFYSTELISAWVTINSLFTMRNELYE